LLELEETRLASTPKMLGKVVENFVILELLKQTTWHSEKISLFQYHTETHQEVDIILENSAKKVVGIEVKSGETVSMEDFRYLKAMKEAIGEDFIRGIVFYSGSQILSFGQDLYALSISSLWS
jgi:predicted AAA+ superfamily ATPase